MVDPMETTETAKLEKDMEEENNKASNCYVQPVLTASEESQNGSSKPKGLTNSLRKDTKRYPDYSQIALSAESRNKFPSEWWKTGIALVYAIFSCILMSFMVIVVNERVPPKELSPPLPDKFFDYIDHVEWAFSVSEISGIILLGLWAIQWLFLRYKSIVGRRYCFILGTVGLYRCITIYVTTLPVPGIHIQCAPKLNGDFKVKIQQIFQLISSGGFAIAGSPSLCGDYLFSGHSLLLTITYLFIKEYSPCRFWWYHLICWLMNAVALICILAAHEHYTVDVIVAYYISTRFFWWYHTMANEKNLKVSSQTNFMSRAWWYPIFNFFEKNVQGSVPCCFSWPISWTSSCFESLCKKNHRVQKLGEDNEKSPEEN